MATAIQILLVLLVLFNFFVLYMCAKRWRIVHVIFTFFAFATAIAFIFFASASLKTRIAWQKAFQAREKELEKEQKDEQILKFGNLEQNFEAVETTLLGVKAAVEQEQYDRGRIWNGCVPGRFDGRSVTVATFTPDPAAPPDTATRNNRLAEKMILFAFKEREVNAGDPFKTPYQYLGEFVATGVTETSVTLAPTLPLDPVQTAGLNTVDSTWALYEVMPVDSHEAFKGYMTNAGFKEFTRDELKAILGTDEKQIVDQYAFDLKPIREIQAIDKDFEPPPERIWFKVKFLKAHTIDVDSNEAPAADKTLFDTAGRALPLALRQENRIPDMEPGKTVIKVGWLGLFDRDSATQLIADGICEKVDEVYVRPLNNYEQYYREIDKRFKQLAEHAAEVSLNTANLKAANVAAKKQEDYRTSERNNADTDLKAVQYELAEVTKYRLALESALAKKRGELGELYRTNNLLAAELAAIQQKIADDLSAQSAAPALEAISVP